MHSPQVDEQILENARRIPMFKKTALAASIVMMSTATVYAEGPYRIGITQNNVGVDSYQTTYESAFEAAAEANENVEIVVLDAGGDVARQIGQINNLIQQRVDAIIIWPTNGQAVIPAIRQAHKAGIPVVVTNSKIAEAGLEYIAAFSGPDNVQQGASSAEMMCDALDGEGQIVQISGQPGYTTAMERAGGFEERLAELCPGVELLETQPGNWNRERAQRVMEDFLTKYDRIDGVYAGDDNMGVGALNAAKGAGRADEIVFIGATNFAVGYDAIERGEYYGSIYQSPVDDAEAALQTALDVLGGQEVPKMNFFETPKITAEILGEFDRPVF
ncbi:sugar ABC transporter substrate-binding protein [Halomonas sp. LBP4]|uniref:sugar ABC transporter substrate-binding protein n=1 Tax=Halomonas sp. LBP4 TaxID=2044917 RepID=UPI0021AC816E|nr:sugar ABC transporter substrate-binding protein [Halomonas sp. LBP4]